VNDACESMFPSQNDTRIVIHGHQRRNGKPALKAAATKLQCFLPDIQNVKNFEELHYIVNEIQAVPRIGPLAVYDISERIGWYLDVYPEVIYLHAGVTNGVRAMKISLGNKKHISKEVFPVSFQCLKPAEIENILCVYKRYLADPLHFQKSLTCKSARKNRCTLS